MNIDLTTILVIAGAIIAGVVLSRYMRARSKYAVAATVARLDPVTVPTRSGLIPQRSYLSALPPKADIHGCARNVR